MLATLSNDCDIKVTGDSLHLEIFASNKLFVSPQGKQLWSWNKHEIIANMMIETAVSTLKRPSRRESQAMVAIVTNSCVKFYLDKKESSPTIYSLFMKYLTYSSAGVGSQVHRASTKRKLHKRRQFMPSVVADQVVNMAV